MNQHCEKPYITKCNNCGIQLRLLKDSTEGMPVYCGSKCLREKQDRDKLKEQIKQLADLAFDCYDQGYCDGEKRHISHEPTHNWKDTEEYKKLQEILEDES